MRIIPALALFSGLGVLAWKIGDTWTPGNTNMLIMGGVYVTSMFCVVFGIVFGVHWGMRLGGRRSRSDGEPRSTYPPQMSVTPPPPPAALPVSAPTGSWSTDRRYQLLDRDGQEVDG